VKNSFIEQILKVDSKAPVAVWNHFINFCSHPRPSKHEEKIKQYVRSVATAAGMNFKEDQVGNIVVYIPATIGFEKFPTILIQNHLDMVVDALPDKKINFMTDPIEIKTDGDWVRAEGTTLGADNGIGACLALSLIDFHEKLNHPSLELLFTVDEETGLTGALELDPNLINAKHMINIDTEEWGALYIGCAGGLEIKFEQKFSTEKISGEKYLVQISSLIGGHSGIDIHRQRGNAIVMLIDLLAQLVAQQGDAVKLVAINGGKAHNIIPRDARMEIMIDSSRAKQFGEIVDHWKNYWSKILPEEDARSVKYKIENQGAGEGQVLSSEDLKSTLLPFLTLYPHGAHQFAHGSTELLVRLSNNLAKLSLMAGDFNSLTSIRFFEHEEGERLKFKCMQLGEKFQMQMNVKNGYPSWAPNFSSPLLKMVSNSFEELFGHAPQVKAIHAGLECGIITAKKAGLEAVSFGPLIQGAHSPDEKVLIKDVTKCWDFLCFVLKQFLR